MIDERLINEKVDIYLQTCKQLHMKPKQNELAKVLGVSNATISNVKKGRFNGRIYTNKPHIKRCINNNDFKVIQDLFIK